MVEKKKDKQKPVTIKCLKFQVQCVRVRADVLRPHVAASGKYPTVARGRRLALFLKSAHMRSIQKAGLGLLLSRRFLVHSICR